MCIFAARKWRCASEGRIVCHIAERGQIEITRTNLNSYMKSNRNIINIIAGILLMGGMLADGARAQEQGYRWGKWSAGYRNSVGGLSDKVLDSYIDSAGNTYIFGNFGTAARLGGNGPYICPMDSASGGQSTFGVYVAKIDTLGDVLWCRPVIGNNVNTITIGWNMVVKDDEITIAFDTHWGSGYGTWLYFFDTLFTASNDYFRINKCATYFVTFDFDGNRIDCHNMRLCAPFRPNSTTLVTYYMGVGGGRFGIDEDGSIHIFSSSEGMDQDVWPYAYVIVDEDTNRKYMLDAHSLNGVYFTGSYYYKMSSDWRLVGKRCMIDSIAGWQPEQRGGAQFSFTNVVAAGDELYANGYFQCGDYRFAESFAPNDTFLVRILFDSVHCLKIESAGDFNCMPFLIKCDKAGEIEWLQQLYTDGPNYALSNFLPGRQGLSVEEDLVYTQCWAAYFFDIDNKIFLDSAHAIPIENHVLDYVLVTSYDKMSGTPVNYYYVDTVNDSQSGSVAVVGDEVIMDVAFYLLGKAELCRVNKHTKEVTRTFPIYSSTDVQTQQLSVSSSGRVFRGETGSNFRVEDSIFVGNYQEANVMTFYYDSSLDMRIKPCPKVDSLWCGGVVWNTAAIAWSSGYGHEGYEVAYKPEDVSWDEAAVIEAAESGASVTLPDDRCYEFRVRGRCGGRREPASPWSDPITVCPEPAIGIEGAAVPAAMTLSPNPATGQVQIVGLTGEARDVEVLDMAGRTVGTYSHAATFDIAHLPGGSYIVKVTTESDKCEYLKLVKE